MKQLAVVFTLLLLCVLCMLAGEQVDTAMARKPMTAKVMKVRGCDYVVITNPEGDWISLTHAGDCANPVHNAGTDSLSVAGRSVRALRVTVVR